MTSRRSIKVSLPLLAAALALVIAAPSALPATTGPDCFKIGPGNHGGAEGNGVTVRDIDPTAATIVVHYGKAPTCPLLGQLWAEWGKGRNNVDFRAFDRVAAGFTGSDFEKKTFRLTDLTPNTLYSVKGGLGYGFSDYHTSAETFKTDPSRARDLDLFGFQSKGELGRFFTWTFIFDPRASSFGTTLVSVIYGKEGEFNFRSNVQKCFIGQRRDNRCDPFVFGSNFNKPGYNVAGIVPSGTNFDEFTRYNARLDLRNNISGDQLGPVFKFECNLRLQCRVTS